MLVEVQTEQSVFRPSLRSLGVIDGGPRSRPQQPRRSQPTSLRSHMEEQKKPSDHLYWSRTPSTTKPVEHRPLDPEAAAVLECRSRPGASWNAAATWEEKDISKWVRETLGETMLPITLEFDASANEVYAWRLCEPALEPGASVRIALRVKDVTVSGEATHVLSRGKQRVVLELGIKLKLEVEVRQGESPKGILKQILTGILNVTEASRRARHTTAVTPPSAGHRTAAPATAQPFFSLAATRHERVERRRWSSGLSASIAAG
jgi:hypothetical protein